MEGKELLERIELLESQINCTLLEKKDAIKMLELENLPETNRKWYEKKLKSSDVELKKYIGERGKIIDKIRSMDNKQFSNILFQRFVMKETQSEIAKSLNYTTAHVKRLQKQAISEFEQKSLLNATK